MKETIKSDLKKLQDHAYYALEAFDDFCELHNLKYSLAFGTLLGAIRHGGFIPWDDDIDVAMPRNEYERFLKLAVKDFDQDFFIQNHLTEENNYHFFTRVCVKNTMAVQTHYKNLDNHKGVFIDVFVFDEMAPPNERKKHLRQMVALKRLKRIPSDKLKPLDIIVGALNKLFPKSLTLRNINKKLDKISQKYNGKGMDYLFNSGNATGKSSKGDYFYEGDKIPTQSFDKLVKHKFRNKEFSIFANYEEILEMKYGDYMELPPKKDRTPHHGFEEFVFREDILERYKVRNG